MNSYFEYLLQSGLSLGIFYLGYRLLLQNETSFMQNRIYLLFGILCSVILPIFQINVPVQTSAMSTVWLEEIVVHPEGLFNNVANGMTSSDILLGIYLLGVGVLSVRLIYQLLLLLVMIRRFGVQRKNGDLIVFTEDDLVPFSVLNLIFINSSIKDPKAFHKILAHERVHIRQKHTLDLILVELLTIVQWFNPFVWFIQKAIKANHEYLADQGVLSEGHNRLHYQHLLLKQVFGAQVSFLANNFNQSLIKRRLTMMSKIKNNRSSVLKMVFLLPVSIALTVFFTLSVSNTILAQDREAQVQRKAAGQEQKDEDPVFVVVEEMPTFKGGNDELYNYMASNIKYPEEAKKDGITGITYITFVVEKDGSVSNAKVLRGFNDACDQEALRVVEAMPDWNPGKQKGQPVRVQFNLPIKFNLDKAKSQEKK